MVRIQKCSKNFGGLCAHCGFPEHLLKTTKKFERCIVKMNRISIKQRMFLMKLSQKNENDYTKLVDFSSVESFCADCFMSMKDKGKT